MLYFFTELFVFLPQNFITSISLAIGIGGKWGKCTETINSPSSPSFSLPFNNNYQSSKKSKFLSKIMIFKQMILWWKSVKYWLIMFASQQLQQFCTTTTDSWTVRCLIGFNNNNNLQQTVFLAKQLLFPVSWLESFFSERKEERVKLPWASRLPFVFFQLFKTCFHFFLNFFS